MASRTIAAVLGLVLVGALGGEVCGARTSKPAREKTSSQLGKVISANSRDVSASSRNTGDSHFSGSARNSATLRKLLQNAVPPSVSPTDGTLPNGALCSYLGGLLSFCCLPDFTCPVFPTPQLTLGQGCVALGLGASVPPVAAPTAPAPGPVSPGPFAGPTAGAAFAGAPTPGAGTAGGIPVGLFPAR